MKYRIKSSQFCSLAQEIKFQRWLSETNEKLYLGLIDGLKKKLGCSASIKLMSDIQAGLQNLGLGQKLVDFLLKEYPITIEAMDDNAISNFPTISDPPKFEIHNVGQSQTKIIPGMIENPVFKFYNPSLLMFPQKMILFNLNRGRLVIDTVAFLMDKIGGDYIIVGDKSYIEYFKYKYKDEVSKVPKSSREIVLYRKRHGLGEDARDG